MGGTKIRQNHIEGESDVTWGLAVKGAAWVFGLMAVVMATLFSAGLIRVFAMSAKLDVIEARQIAVLDRLKTVEIAISAEDYVTRGEINSWLQSDARQNSIRAMSKETVTPEDIYREIQRMRYSAPPATKVP